MTVLLLLGRETFICLKFGFKVALIYFRTLATVLELSDNILYLFSITFLY